jgi:uncharacterized repeat protein (TIGR01451 family)
MGPDDANDVQINDLMPAGIRFISSQPSQGAYNELTGEWEVGVIGAGSHAMIDITAEVADAGPLTNNAGIGHLSEFDPNQTNDYDETIVSGRTADLSVLKTLASAGNPTLLDDVDYYIEVTNHGPNDASGVVVTDLVPDGLTYQSSVASNGTYHSGTGVWDVGALANGASANLTITAKIDQTGSISNTAVRTASHPTDINGANDTDSVTINVLADGDGDGMPDEWEFDYGLNLGMDDANDDLDGDGLLNIQEYDNGTDPNLSDTDSDEMPDGWEVTYGLNPLVDDDAEADVDKDGYTNLEEYLYRTQPNDGSSKPLPPTADAGPDQTQDQSVAEGDTVTLDGSNSSDPNNDIVEYYWRQTGDEPDVLPDRISYAVQPTFVAPQVGPGGESFTFELKVTDRSGQQDTDTCIVIVSWFNDPPTADAGEDQTVDEGVTVTLDGSGSADADDGIQSYRWTQTAGIRIN